MLVVGLAAAFLGIGLAKVVLLFDALEIALDETCGVASGCHVVQIVEIELVGKCVEFVQELVALFLQNFFFTIQIFRYFLNIKRGRI